MKFIDCLLQKPIKYEEIFNIIKNEIISLKEKDFDLKNSLFEKYSIEIKMLFQSNQNLFWKFWDFCENYQKIDKYKNDSEIVTELRENGICVVEKYFDNNDLLLLKEDWNFSMNKFPNLTDSDIEKTLKNRFVFKTIDKINYVKGSDFDGKRRIIYSNKDTFPNNFRKLLNENQEFKSIIQDYFYVDSPIFPNAIMAENLFEPKYYRDDYYWHIDNLSDQFKIMIILEDMTLDDAPFIYINKTHKVYDCYKNRYHKMYAINGITTQESNHFEETFSQTTESVRKAVLKAGDVVFFDCKIHHTASFCKNNGNRKNIMIYYNSIPTIRNKILYKIDSYLNFGLR